jgi:hypothetical protein
MCMSWTKSSNRNSTLNYAMIVSQFTKPLNQRTADSVTVNTSIAKVQTKKQANRYILCLISSFRREVNENCALLGYYAVSSA